MVARGTDTQRLGELTGNKVEFRQFSAPATDSSEWSLLNAVSRSAEPSRILGDAPKIDVPPARSHEPEMQVMGHVEAVRPLQPVTVPVPVSAPQPVSTPDLAPVSVESRTVRTAPETRPGFAHLFRKTPVDESSATTPLAELLKAISRCP